MTDSPPPAARAITRPEMVKVERGGEEREVADSVVTRLLLQLQPPLDSLRTFTHATECETFEQAAAERGQEVGQIVRSIVFRLSGGRADFVLVLCPGGSKVAWPAIRKRLKARSITMAREEEVLAVTGHRVGSVSPFALPGSLRVLADAECFVPEEISIGSGLIGTTVILSQPDFARALRAAVAEAMLEIGEFAALKESS